MKKIYLSPAIEALEINMEGVLMVSPDPFVDPNDPFTAPKKPAPIF